MTDVQEQQEPRFTIYLRLAREIFEAKYAKDVSSLYRQASELKEKLTRFNELSKDEISSKTAKEQRDDQLTAMTLRKSIFEDLPNVLCQIRILQLKFEQDVEKEYNKQAYKSKGNVTPIDDDAIWVSVLPAEIADLIPDVISEAPREVISTYKALLDKRKQSKNDSLYPLLDAAFGNKLMTSRNMSKLRESERLTERLTHSNRHSILAMSMSRCHDNTVAKSRAK